MTNLDFQLGFDAGFSKWGNSGISRLKDLFSAYTVMTSEHMIEEYAVPRQDFFLFTADKTLYIA